MIVLCDIDNVLSDDGWRVEFIRHTATDPLLRWHDYHVACPLDAVCNRELVEEGNVILLTAMPVDYAPLRQRWLEAARLRYHRVMYRDTRDHRSAVEVKRAMLATLRTEGVNLDRCVAAYDDRQDVVDMFCAEGLPGERVAIREYKERHPWLK